jgi:hypothetical protein
MVGGVEGMEVIHVTVILPFPYFFLWQKEIKFGFLKSLFLHSLVHAASLNPNLT